MGLFRKEVDNWDIAQKIMSQFSKELKVLRTCDEYPLELAMFNEFHNEEVRLRYGNFEKAIPALKEALEKINTRARPPLDKKYVEFHCMCIKLTVFKIR